MNQENHNREDLGKIAEDLQSLGVGSRLKVLLTFKVNPNEFHYTNTTIFISSYLEKNSFGSETEIKYYQDPPGRRNMLRISGSFLDVRKIQEDFSKFPWVLEGGVELISEEEY